LEIDGELVP